jgi:hypothetical protein
MWAQKLKPMQEPVCKWVQMVPADMQVPLLEPVLVQEHQQVHTMKVAMVLPQVLESALEHK